MVSNIDQVIARSRQPGTFSERKKFTVARQRALKKMRKFALAHPAYYIVELIQAATANGATYVDIEIERGTVVLSYVGGSFTEDQLGQLFDFLFASKELLELADVRQLALGVNALLLCEPREVVIESGDGTLKGTTRVRIDGKKSTVEVGTPTAALKGTFLRATGLKRSILGHGLGGFKEVEAIESRCLASTIPIIVNTIPLFGYTSQRTPRLFGCENSISFDEGDLYGTIGASKYDGESRDFKILTWGVWVESVREELIKGYYLGGIICFDRLHKTADHSAIVRDERYKQMWARLLPYARQLKSGRTGDAVFDVSLLDGTKLSTAKLRELLRDAGGAVVVPRFEGRHAAHHFKMAAIFGEALELPVLIRGSEHIETLRLLAGSKIRLVEPNVDDVAELEFYRQPRSEPPARPWLIGEMKLDPMPTESFLESLEQLGLLHFAETNEQSQRDEINEIFGSGAELQATIYTPENPQGDADLWVEVRTAGRTVWSGGVQNPFPGHVLVIDAPDLSPKAFQEPLKSFNTNGDGSNVSLAELLAGSMARLVLPSLEAATERVLLTLGHLESKADTAASRIALAALARSAIKRLRAKSDGKLQVQLSLLDPKLPESLLDVPLFQSLDGTPRSARDLESIMDETGGLVYGVVPGIEPNLQGMYPPRILALDLFRERMLVSLLGEASYVRVDCRDVLASQGPIKCRDIAIGLRQFPKFPLLIEGGADPVSWTPDERHQCEASLVDQLISLFSNRSVDEELRRQAARHILWYLFFKHTIDDGSEIIPKVRTLPLFLGVDGRAHSFAEIEPLLMSEKGITMFDGWATDSADLGAIVRNDDQTDATPAPQVGLAMNPFLFHILSRIGRVRPALDVDLSDSEAADNPETPQKAFLVEVRLDESFVEGVIGVPHEVAEEGERQSVLVFDKARQRVTSIYGPSQELGVIGRLQMKRPLFEGDLSQIEQLIRRAGYQVLDELISRIPGLASDSDEFERCSSLALRFAGQSLQLIAEPDGRIVFDVLRPEAQRILDLPLFPTPEGVAVSAFRLLRRWIAKRQAGDTAQVDQWLLSSTPKFLVEWLRDFLRPERTVYLPGRASDTAVAQTTAAPIDIRSHKELGYWLTETLATLRLDEMGELNPTQVHFASIDNEQMKVDGVPIFSMKPDQLHAFCHIDGEPALVLNDQHWLVQRTLERVASDPEASMWLLLACYAHLNEILQLVTNDHELAFHRRVFECLEGGDLQPFSSR